MSKEWVELGPIMKGGGDDPSWYPWHVQWVWCCWKRVYILCAEGPATGWKCVQDFKMLRFEVTMESFHGAWLSILSVHFWRAADGSVCSVPVCWMQAEASNLSDKWEIRKTEDLLYCCLLIVGLPYMGVGPTQFSNLTPHICRHWWFSEIPILGFQLKFQRRVYEILLTPYSVLKCTKL